VWHVGVDQPDEKTRESVVFRLATYLDPCFHPPVSSKLAAYCGRLWIPGNGLGSLGRFSMAVWLVRAGRRGEQEQTALIVQAGEWVQYSSPSPEGAEYVAVCVPAFPSEMVYRE